MNPKIITTSKHVAIDAVVTAVQEKKDFAVVFTGGAWEIELKDELNDRLYAMDQGGLEREFTDL